MTIERTRARQSGVKGSAKTRYQNDRELTIDLRSGRSVLVVKYSYVCTQVTPQRLEAP